MMLLGLMLLFTVVQALLAGLLLGGADVGSYMDQQGKLYGVLAVGSLFTFLLPAIFLQIIEKNTVYFPREYVNKLIYGIVLLFLFAFSPVMQLVREWNASMSLPESLRAVEVWMRAQEDSMAELTAKVVMVDSVPLLLLNVLVMAIFPAIAEEFFFRGSLMHIIQRMVRNPHTSIWITAVIFSAIHLQFYGFFPRLLLGALFGYMMLWSGNIWVPIVGHFINNASVTILAFYYVKQGKTYADLQTYESYSIFVYIGAVVLTVLIGYWFYRCTVHKRKMYGKRLD
jgi:membrane protease YdiL (CAAX protease family)